jgi:hypothetical protein
MWIALWTAIKLAAPFLKRFVSLPWLKVILGGIEKWAETKGAEDQLKASVAIAEINAEMKSREAMAQVLIAEHGWSVTRWIRPLFAYPLVAYWGIVVIDKLMHFEWEAEPLPSPLDEWAGWIVTAYFLTRPIEKAARLFRK